MLLILHVRVPRDRRKGRSIASGGGAGTGGCGFVAVPRKHPDKGQKQFVKNRSGFVDLFARRLLTFPTAPPLALVRASGWVVLLAAGDARNWASRVSAAEETEHWRRAEQAVVVSTGGVARARKGRKTPTAPTPPTCRRTANARAISPPRGKGTRPEALTMFTRRGTASVTLAFFALLGQPLVADGAITDAAVKLSSAASSATAVRATVTFTLPAGLTIPDQGKIKLTFPTSW